jgi:hypothetical protein
MKTAVEWLANELCYITDNGRYIIDNTDDVTDVVNQAKEMEKVQDLQQWIETWSLGYNSGWDNCIKKFKQQEQ